MPYFEWTLPDLLNSTAFSPHPLLSFSTSPASSSNSPSPQSWTDREKRHTILSKSLSYQLLAALAYLHHPSRGIGHRDVKPLNVVLDQEGCVRVIDFGIAWAGGRARVGDLWPEEEGKMYFEVSTG